jgi:hypothetical protein
MFGFGKSEAEIQKEALIAQSKKMVTEMVNKMNDASRREKDTRERGYRQHH